jgi:putative flippase GtrA
MRYALRYLLFGLIGGLLAYAALTGLSSAPEAVRLVAAVCCGLAAALLTNRLYPLKRQTKS